MLHKRIIACLDVKNGRVVKGSRFVDLRDMGDPVELAARYEAEGADEIVFLDISASAEGRRTLLDVVQRTAEGLFIPLTVGGGVNDLEGIGAVLRAGADKVSINTAAVQNPELLREASVEFGRQCIIASIDARVEKRQIEIAARPQGAVADAMIAPGGMWFRVFTHGGRTATELDAVTWAKQCEELGAGEILLTSMDTDGTRNGYDLELIGAESPPAEALEPLGMSSGVRFRIHSHGGTFGFLEVFSTVADAFNADDQAFLGGVTYLLAAAIEQQRLHQELEVRAETDDLTGLLKRVAFEHRLVAALGQAERNKTKVAVLFMDLDLFKEVNDSLGHHAGDLVLNQVANRVKEAVRSWDVVARHGGDEFVLFLPDIKERTEIEHVTARLLATLGEPYEVESTQVMVGATIGVAVYPDDGTTVKALLKAADSALYRGKARDRAAVHFESDEPRT